jgi:glyoxylase-like metal-dependent hydrolase (beta-lactamase superfamily II)
MSEIASGVHRIDTPLGERVNTVWLLQGSRGSLLYDTAVDTAIPDHVLPYLETHGLDPAAVTHVVVSHSDVDHFGGIADAHEAFRNAQVGAHRLDARLIESYQDFERERVRGFLPTWGYDEDPDAIAWCRSVVRVDRVDRRLTGGEVVDLGDREVEVHAVPGHTRGSLALRDRPSGAWLVSDAVLGTTVPLADGTPAFAPTYRYVDDYLATLDLLEASSATMLATAHYGVLVDDAARGFLQASRDFAHRLEDCLVAEIGERGPATLAELLPEINAQMASWPLDGTEPSLAFPVVAHLERLIDRGRVVVTRNAGGKAVASLTA